MSRALPLRTTFGAGSDYRLYRGLNSGGSKLISWMRTPWSTGESGLHYKDWAQVSFHAFLTLLATGVLLLLPIRLGGPAQFHRLAHRSPDLEPVRRDPCDIARRHALGYDAFEREEFGFGKHALA
jgi:hypothetical protein